MKKFVASTLATLLLVQSITPATYAAKISNAKDDAAGIVTTQAPATDVASETTSPASETTSVGNRATDKTKSINLETYKSMDLGKANALQILQIAAYGFAYTQ